ncbi:MAG: phosphoenolpyruvate carboxykinase (GTP) [Planctomycetota bacterium]
MKDKRTGKTSVEAILRASLDENNRRKLAAIDNPKVHAFVADAVELCRPSSVFVCGDSPEEIRHIRDQAIALGEETPLAIPGHTVHFDGPEDQGRDREVTRYLVPKTDHLSKALNQIERKEGLREIHRLLKDAMTGRTMIVRFLSLGPTDSAFSIPCVQCTDSFYVAHSEDLLYRPAYPQFTAMGHRGDLFCFLHSAGKLSGSRVSAESDKKRIYIDYSADTIYSVNTQYAGNTVGLKKLALRLTIRKADREGWLAEHMFLMGVPGRDGRKTYFAGAFPSACGKTSTAMLPGETIVGDDIAYFRNVDGVARAVNAERGIFGIIQSVNPADDPSIFKVLASPGEVIFSNVLVRDREPYWLGMGREIPKEGVNFSGPWREGKPDERGNPVPPAHKNARYTVALNALDNADEKLDDPAGVPVEAILYGGRDAHAYVPVQQGLSWEHGIIAYGASLETETTFAILGKEGVAELNLMSIQDFVAIPLGKYICNNLDFGGKLAKPPLVFGVNYFLRNRAGKFTNAVRDKHVWLRWMELRVHQDVDAVVAPTGCIPRYEDLVALFMQLTSQEYRREHYVEQFTIRVPENLKKIERVLHFYRSEVPDAPATLFEVLEAQRERLLAAHDRFGDYVSPLDLAAGPR